MGDSRALAVFAFFVLLNLLAGFFVCRRRRNYLVASDFLLDHTIQTILCIIVVVLTPTGTAYLSAFIIMTANSLAFSFIATVLKHDSITSKQYGWKGIGAFAMVCSILSTVIGGLILAEFLV